MKLLSFIFITLGFVSAKEWKDDVTPDGQDVQFPSIKEREYEIRNMKNDEVVKIGYIKRENNENSGNNEVAISFVDTIIGNVTLDGQNVQFSNDSWINNLTDLQVSRFQHIAGLNLSEITDQKGLSEGIIKLTEFLEEDGEHLACNTTKYGNCADWSDVHCITFDTLGGVINTGGTIYLELLKDGEVVRSGAKTLKKSERWGTCPREDYDEFRVAGNSTNEWFGKIWVDNKQVVRNGTSGFMKISNGRGTVTNDTNHYICSSADPVVCPIWKEGEVLDSGKHRWEHFSPTGNQCVSQNTFNACYEAFDSSYVAQLCHCLRKSDLTDLVDVYTQLVLENSSSSMAYSALLMLCMWLFH